MVDWTDGNSSVTEHFNVSDCLTLHNWNRLATEADGADFDKLTTLCQKMEQVRSVLGCPINIHCMFRSTAYNLEQNILPPTGLDVHAMNLAADLDANEHLTIQQVKDLLQPQLESLGIRMEDNGHNASWVHLDLHPVINNRFFKV
jgi:hypothetical protein